MWIVRERRREEALPDPHVVEAGGGGCFRVIGASGNIMVDEAGLEAIALDDTELLRGLSHGAPLCRRKETGLI